MSKSENQSHMNYSALQPVLLKKLHTWSVFRVTTFFQFKSTKAALDILPHYMHDFDKNLKTQYSKLVTNNDFDHGSYDVRKCSLTYSALLRLCSDELAEGKLQITQLTIQTNNIVATLGQTGPKWIKRGIIHSLFNFLIGESKGAEETNAIKNNMAI